MTLRVALPHQGFASAHLARARVGQAANQLPQRYHVAGKAAALGQSHRHGLAIVFGCPGKLRHLEPALQTRQRLAQVMENAGHLLNALVEFCALLGRVHVGAPKSLI